MTAPLTYDRSGPEPTLYDVMDVLVRMDGRLETVETDVAELKHDVAGLKIDVAVLKTDVASLETNMRLMERTQARMLEEIEELQEGYAGLSRAFDRDAEAAVDHEQRIGRLERASLAAGTGA